MQLDYLMHYGVKGMRWGIRKKSSQKLFVSGSSKTQDPSSGYLRRKLPRDIKRVLKDAMHNRDQIIVGDAPGIDRQTQKYLKRKHYKNVVIYGPGKKVRYAASKKWKTRAIDAPEYETGSGEWLAKKDIAMTKAATRGLAVVLDEGAKATRNNVSRLQSQNKPVKVYELSKYGKKKDRWW
jgi:hypothetical protein